MASFPEPTPDAEKKYWQSLSYNSRLDNFHAADPSLERTIFIKTTCPVYLRIRVLYSAWATIHVDT